MSIESLGIRQEVIELKKTPKTFTNITDAVDYANKDEGDEVIVEVTKEDKSKEFVVIDVKKNVKPENIFDSQLKISPSILTRENKTIEVITVPFFDNDKIDQALSLGELFLKDTASGFTTKEAYNVPRLQIYQKNALTTYSTIEQAIKDIEARKNEIQEKINRLRNNNSEPSIIKKNEEKLNQLEIQLNELKTLKTCILSKLLTLPQTGTTIPETNLKVGQYRNDFSKSISLIRERIGELQGKLLEETDKDIAESIKSQIDKLRSTISDIQISDVQKYEAVLKIKLRVGSLASINNNLQKTKLELEAQLTELKKYQDILNNNPKLAVKSNIEQKINELEKNINSTRNFLIKLMEEDLKTFKENVPIINGKPQKGAADAIELLELQIDKLKKLDITSKNLETETKELLKIVKETQDKLLINVKNAGKNWDGISPQEAGLLENIVQNTDNLIVDYKKAKAEFEVSKKNIELGKNIIKFEEGLYNLADDPEATYNIIDIAKRTNDKALQTQLLIALGKPAFSNDSINKFEEEYNKGLKELFDNAPDNSPLKELGKCYAAISLANNKDWKDKIDIDKLKAKIENLSKSPDVIKAFEDLRTNTLKRVFGDLSIAAKKQEEYILSDKFQQLLKLLPPDKKQSVIENELKKLSMLAPDKIIEVSQQFTAKFIERNGLEMYLSLSPNDAQNGIKNFLSQGNIYTLKDLIKDGKKITKFMNSAGKMAEAIDKAIRQAKFEGKLFDIDKDLILALEKLGKNHPGVAEAIEFISDLSKSGKLGALDGVFAGFTLFAKGIPKDVKGYMDSGSSLLSLMSKTKDFAKVLGMSDEALKAGTFGKALSFCKWLGPLADGLSAGVSIWNMTEEIKNGDTWGATFKGLSAVGSLTSMGAGIVAIAAGCSGPAAPLVVGGVVVGLAAWGLDSWLGESKEETLLRQLGVLKK